MAKSITLSLGDSQQTSVVVQEDDYNKEAPVQLMFMKQYQTQGSLSLSIEDASLLLMALKNVIDTVKK